jgi:hypothetical protein
MMAAPSLIHNGKKLVETEKNVLLIGRHGTGKTESVRTLATEMGLKLVAFSCATLDPYTELVGVPVPVDRVLPTGGTRKALEMIRPLAIDEADIVFFDELNRARQETQDAVLEIINNRTINGEPLPNLKCCWAAINPAGEDYNVDELDPALMDRFDVFLEFKPRPSVVYMSQFIPKKRAIALMSWWKAHNKDKRSDYISPRRLMKLGLIYEHTRDNKTLIAALPPGGKFDSSKLWDMLQTSDEMDDAIDAEKMDEVFENEDAHVKPPMGINYYALRHAPERQLKELADYLKQNPFQMHDHHQVAESILEKRVGAEAIVERYGSLLNEVNINVLVGFMNNMTEIKRSQVRTAFRNLMATQAGLVRARKMPHLHKVIDQTAKNTNAKLPPLN